MARESKAEEQRELYESYKRSGKRLSEFSRECGIEIWKVQAAVKKIEGSLPARKFREVKVVNSEELKGLKLSYAMDCC